MGQSLGTAVATAAVEHFASQYGMDFAGLVLVAGFLDLPTLLRTYAIGGFVPLLSPLKLYPKVQKFFASKAVDLWPTAARLANWVRSSPRLNLHLVHAEDDWEIASSHSDALFYAAANATSSGSMTIEQIDGVKTHTDYGTAGWSNSWTSESPSGGLRTIKQVRTRHGGKFLRRFSELTADK